MEVIKANGDRVPFDIEKVKSSISRTGASAGIVDRVASEVEERVKDGMTTRELYKIVFDILQNQSVCYACRYNLRTAILKLGPAGFKFEKYVAAILRAYGYDAHVPDEEYEGACVWHEIDGVAEKDGRRIVIEAKFRNSYRNNVNLKDTMATWTRFLDLVEGASLGKGPHFDEVWIMTNARFSDRSRQFGECKGMHLCGWQYPEGNSFERMVDNRALYPITVIDGLKQHELEKFAFNRLILCKEVSASEPEDLVQRIGMKLERAQEIIELCTAVVEGENTSE